MKALEEEKAEKEKEEKAKAGIPTPPPDKSTPKQAHFQPKSLFTTPQSKKASAAGSPNTPASIVEVSDVETLSVSSDHSSVTPELGKLSLGRGRGRPRKELIKPNFDDFPIDGTDEEQKRYVKKKRTELWRFNKLTGSGASEYRQSELERVKGYQEKKKKTSECSASASDESGSEHKRKLSRAR